MRRELLGWLLAGTIGLASADCTAKSCQDYFVCPSYSIRLVDEDTGQAICSASITMDPGPSSCGGKGVSQSSNCHYLAS